MSQEKVTVFKIGGNIIDDAQALQSFIQQLSTIKGLKILVHGGGKLATSLATTLGIQQEMIEGRRVTDEATLRVVTMVYAGLVNKNIVALLQANKVNAIGLCGADANLIPAVKRPLKNGIDYGFVGDVSSCLVGEKWQLFLENGLMPVMAPITHDGQGQLLNTNADTIANEVAVVLSKYYKVSLIYVFEKKGVLLDAQDDDSVISAITPTYYQTLKSQNIIFAGMIPKLDNAFDALSRGVSKVTIGLASELSLLTAGTAGTTIIHE